MKRHFRVRYIELDVGRNGGSGKPKSFERWANKGKDASHMYRGRRRVRIISAREIK